MDIAARGSREISHALVNQVILIRNWSGNAESCTPINSCLVQGSAQKTLTFVWSLQWMFIRDLVTLSAFLSDVIAEVFFCKASRITHERNQ